MWMGAVWVTVQRRKWGRSVRDEKGAFLENNF